MTVTKIHSPESSRAKVSKNDINQHFDNLHQKLLRCHYPALVLNMDESGFSKRPDKNTIRNCNCIKRCSITPSFLDENDGNHISIVAGVTFSEQALKPLLIYNTQQPLKEVFNSPLRNSFLWCKTARGYLNEEAMLFWLQNIYLPYLDHAKSIINDLNAQALLICDSLKSHQTDKVSELLEKIILNY